jgi:SAM-dependent methyltransferase
VTSLMTLDQFIAARVMRDVYEEPPSDLHNRLTDLMLTKCEKFINLNGARVLDLGCGQGHSLRRFLEKGAKPLGITYGADVKACLLQSLSVLEVDIHDLSGISDTYYFIWCRHILEHSLCPLFTLYQVGSLLKGNGLIYVEVPLPGTCARHERNPNHYSCFTVDGWVALFHKADLSVVNLGSIKIKIPLGEDEYFYFILRHEMKEGLSEKDF